MRPEIKNDCAGEGQQQFTGLDSVLLEKQIVVQLLRIFSACSQESANGPYLEKVNELPFKTTHFTINPENYNPATPVSSHSL